MTCFNGWSSDQEINGKPLISLENQSFSCFGLDFLVFFESVGLQTHFRCWGCIGTLSKTDVKFFIFHIFPTRFFVSIIFHGLIAFLYYLPNNSIIIDYYWFPIGLLVSWFQDSFESKNQKNIRTKNRVGKFWKIQLFYIVTNEVPGGYESSGSDLDDQESSRTSQKLSVFMKNPWISLVFLVRTFPM